MSQRVCDREEFGDLHEHVARQERGEIHVANGPYRTGSDYWRFGVTWSDGWREIFRDEAEADALVSEFPAPSTGSPQP